MATRKSRSASSGGGPSRPASPNPTTREPEENRDDRDNRENRGPTSATGATTGSAAATESFRPAVDDVDADPDEVALEAYSLYCARGYQHGDDLGDWLAAEQIVKDRKRSRNGSE